MNTNMWLAKRWWLIPVAVIIIGGSFAVNLGHVGEVEAGVVGRVLAGRGVGPAEALAFLSPRLRDWLPDPSHLLDLDRAAARLAQAVPYPPKCA